jgi:hypothetical protein
VTNEDEERQVREEAAELNRRRPLTEAEESRFQFLLDWLEYRIRYDGVMGLDSNWEYFGMSDPSTNRLPSK